MVDQKAKDELAKALKQAQLTEQEKLMQWLPVVAKTSLSGAMAERAQWKKKFKGPGRPHGAVKEGRPSNIELARTFLEQKPASNKSDSALKEAIGKKWLGRTASITAIDRGLKELSG